MVFPEIVYHFCALLRGTSGIASALVASANNMAVEGRSLSNNTGAQFNPVSGSNGIHSKYQRVLPVTQPASMRTGIHFFNIYHVKGDELCIA